MANVKTLRHIHTWRCGHASDEPEEAYIQKAMELGAEAICFSDHAPFQGNPFRNRMRYDQLDEYVSTLQELREKYQGSIAVKIGLEIEYLPSFRTYYEELLASGSFDFLMMGQHFYELPDGTYSFQLQDRTGEDRGVMEAMYEGMQTGYFTVAAHPDLAFRRRKKWEPDMAALSQKVFDLAIKHDVALEYNGSSLGRKYHHWEEFWEVCPEYVPVLGLDAHSVEDIEKSLARIAKQEEERIRQIGKHLIRKHIGALKELAKGEQV